jgi:hypothetical protein
MDWSSSFALSWLLLPSCRPVRYRIVWIDLHVDRVLVSQNVQIPQKLFGWQVDRSNSILFVVVVLRYLAVRDHNQDQRAI